MDTEKQRIAIAEACGWKHVDYDKDHSRATLAGISPATGNLATVPDYPSDLNAMHAAEKALADDQQRVFCHELRRIVCGDAASESSDEFYTITAAAAQRAEAFLRTLELWED